MPTNLKSSKFLSKVMNKLSRYSKSEKIFIWYLIILLFFLLILPIVRVTSTDSSYHLLNWMFSKSALIIFISMIVLLCNNISFKFKNLFTFYFWWRENEWLVNFVFLFIIVTSIFGITDGAHVANVAKEVSATWWCIFIEILLLTWIVLSVVSIVKKAQEIWKKSKIINIVDEEKEKKEEIKDEIKKWLFDNDTQEPQED